MTDRPLSDDEAGMAVIIKEMRRKLDASEAKVARLREAALALQGDMLERAECGADAISGEQYRIVNAGNSAWANFCAALQETGA